MLVEAEGEGDMEVGDDMEGVEDMGVEAAVTVVVVVEVEEETGVVEDGEVVEVVEDGEGMEEMDVVE